MYLHNKKISILITNYNKKNFLKSCLTSCLNQNYKNFEIIILDNFSNDGSQLLLKQFEKKCIIKKKKRVHINPAMNQIDLIKTGIKFCTGNIICLLDSDDYFSRKKLKIINKNFQMDKNLSILFDVPLIKNKNHFYKLKISNFLKKNTWPTIINTSSISIKKNFLKKCIESNFFENYPLLEVDFRINAICRILNPKYKIIENSLTIYRVGILGIMSKLNKFSKLWWIKRLQAHNYMAAKFKSVGKKYVSFLDYKFTKMVNLILNYPDK